MDRKELQHRIEAGNFAENNGLVMRTINILMGKEIKLRSLEYALPKMPPCELAESLVYLQEAGYVKVRSVYSKIDADVADADYDDTEARLTARGMQLLKGYIADPAVSV